MAGRSIESLTKNKNHHYEIIGPRAAKPKGNLQDVNKIYSSSNKEALYTKIKSGIFLRFSSLSFHMPLSKESVVM